MLSRLLSRKSPTDIDQAQPAATIDQSISQSKLLQLPAEILYAISESCSESDTACLALCCGRTRQLFPRVHHLIRRADPQQKIDYLRRRARDIDGVYACGACLKVHRVDYLGPPGPLFHSSRKQACQVGGVEKSVLDFDDEWIYCLRHEHVDIVMKNWRCQRAGLSAESLSYREVRLEQQYTHRAHSIDPSAWYARKLLMHVDARVVSGQLLCRVQKITVRDMKAKASEVERGLRTYTRWWEDEAWPGLKYTVCRCGQRNIPQIDVLGILVVKKYLSKDMLLQPDVVVDQRPARAQCDVCGIECEMYLKEAAGAGAKKIVFVHTTWFHLGDGTTPSNPRSNRAPLPQGIRATFENDPGVAATISLAKCTVDNENCLLRDTYMRKPFRKVTQLPVPGTTPRKRVPSDRNFMWYKRVSWVDQTDYRDLHRWSLSRSAQHITSTLRVNSSGKMKMVAIRH